MSVADKTAGSSSDTPHDPSGRPSAIVMSERRLGALFPTALSHARSAMRQIARLPWSFERTRFELDADGLGTAVYRAVTGPWTFHAVMVAEPVPDDMRTDRSIGLYWDVSCALCEGEWTAQREAHIAEQARRQKYGYGDADTLAITRGNRSARLFNHVVDTLADGNQPDVGIIRDIGYLVRTTGFFGNGRVGTRPLVRFPADHPLRAPFHAQIFTGFLLREFVNDQVEHMSAARSPKAARLHPDLRRYIGIGNSAGIGLIPFAVNHPQILNAWMTAYERAAAAALARKAAADSPKATTLANLVERAADYFRGNLAEGLGHFTEHSVIAGELANVARLIVRFRQDGTINGTPTDRPWQAIADWLAASADPETEEVFRGLCIETYPDIITRFDMLAPVHEDMDVRPWETIDTLLKKLRGGYTWALDLDLSEPDADAVFWYRSQEAYEPRLGVRDQEPGAEFETPMFIVRDVHRLALAMGRMPAGATVADLLAFMTANAADTGMSEPAYKINRSVPAAERSSTTTSRASLWFTRQMRP